MRLVTASQLVRNCGYARKLGRERVRTPSQQAAMGVGTEFHRLVEMYYVNNATPEHVGARSEAEHLFQFALDSGAFSPGAECEVALGLGPRGEYVEVTETEPHVYVPVEPSADLLTAGRADIVYLDEGVVCVGDFKTGRTHLGPPVAIPQLMALGLAAAAREMSRTMRLGIYYARDGVWEWSDDIDLRLDFVYDAVLTDVREMALMDETPRPGEWCDRCWERKQCAAYDPQREVE